MKVVKGFDGEDLMCIGECSIGEIPVTPKGKVNPVQLKLALSVAGINADVRWVELTGKCPEG